MDNLISMRTKCITTNQAVIICLILNTYCSVALPMWIWTEGCVKDVYTSRKAKNFTYSLPSSCFRACGEDSKHIALKGNICRCNVQKYKLNDIATTCHTPCEQNILLECGDLIEGYWSMYRKASKEELASQDIPENASGCVIHRNNSFEGINCNSTVSKCLCSNQVSNKPLICSDNDVGRWSPRACANGFDRLLSEFHVSTLTYACSLSAAWIGLFSFEEKSDFDSPSTSAKETTVSSGSALNSHRTESEYSQRVTSLETKISTPSLTYDSSNILLLSTALKSPIKSVSVAPATEFSPSNTLPLTSGNLHSSFTSIPIVQGNHFVSIFTTPLSSIPILSQSVTYTKHSPSLPATIIAHSTTKMEDHSAVLSLSVSTTSKYQCMSTSLPTTIHSKNSLYIAETSLARSDVSSQINRFPGESSTTEPIKTTWSATTKSTKDATKVEANDVGEEKSARTTTDLLIAVSVTGAIAVFSVFIIGIMIVYVKRSLKRVKTTLNMSTYTGNDASYHVGEDLSHSSFSNNIRARDTSSERTNDAAYCRNESTYFGQANDKRSESSSDRYGASFCGRATRADLNANFDRPSFLYNGRPTRENEYVLY